MQKTRYLELDFLRGIAVFLMIIFHISYDLNYFHFIQIDIYNHHSNLWKYFRNIIVTLFLLSMGISLSIAYEKKFDKRKILKQFYTLFFSSLSITIVTYILYPKYFIYFGILHFITLSFILGLLFVRHSIIALVLGFMIIIFSYFNLIHLHFIYQYFQSLLSLPHKTKDFINFFPWFGVVLIGIFLGKYKLFLFPIKKDFLTKKIIFLGQHALPIYLIHQPFLFGAISLFYYL